MLDRAETHGPQTVMRSGRATVVAVTVEGWERKTKRTGNLVDFFASSPLRGSGLRVERRRDRSQKIWSARS